MAGSSIKIGADVTEFKRGMTEAQASVKALDATIKTNEKSMQMYGKSESYVSTQAGLLNQKLEEQRKIAQNAEKSLKAMEQNGVSKTSKAYQDMQRRMQEARGAMIDTEVALNQLTTGEAEAAKGADQLANSIGGISKKISLDQVTSGIKNITGALENAAKKAAEFGQAIWDNITGSAEWADNAATQALILGMDVEEYQKYVKVFDTVGDITVAEWRKAKLKVQKAINDPTQDQTDILGLLGIATHETSAGKYGIVQGAARDFEEVFWEIGETLRAKVASGEISQDMADIYANALFGKGFDQLNPLFKLGQEGFTAALNEQQVVTEESVNKLADLNDQLIKLEGDFQTLKTEVLASLAPALQEGAKALDSLLGKLIEYLQSEKGQEALQQLGDAVSGLFGDLSKVDPEKVVGGFVDAFTKVTGGIQWLVDNKETAKGILGAIVGGWASLKLMGGAADVLKLVQGLQGLSGGVSLSGISGVGASLGSSIAAALAKVVLPVSLAAILCGPALAEIFKGETPEEKENREKIEEIVEVGKETGGYVTKPTLREALSFANSNGIVPESYVDRAAREAEVQTFVGADGGIYSENGDRIGYAMPKGTGLVQKFRKPGGTKTPAKEISEEIGPVDLDTHFVVSDDVDEDILEQLGIVNIPARISIVGMTGGGSEFSHGGITQLMHANGLPWVPTDNYLALLHRGERVLTASENRHYTYNSNNYFGNVNLNNGQDIEALCDSIDRHNRRQEAGYGS